MFCLPGAQGFGRGLGQTASDYRAYQEHDPFPISQMARVNGTVKFFNHSRGFGFISPDDGGKDVFVHASALERSGVPALNEGDKVSFEIEDDRRGRGKQAANVQLA